ncbi:MAG TPA: C45 family peptidase [Paracoccaceae bacterium]|nr:C45 family peptidase [Paracoccaceae bacterium]
MRHDDRHSEGGGAGSPLTVAFRSVAEAAPGPKWQAIFRHGWPGWAEWFGRRGDDAEEARRAERALRRHMPELVPLWERLVELAGGDARAAHFLTFWSPPRYLVHCSQAVLVDAQGPALVRNYDLDPRLNEGRLFASAWLGRDVIGMVEGLAGLADGMNGAGLVVSLAFGGRPALGRGFGVPLIVRYLLQVCTEVADAVEALRGLPCHMAYNLTLLDRRGAHATVMLAPDRPAMVSTAAFATNHQLGVEWPRHGRLSQTLERATYLEEVLAQPGLDADGLLCRFLAPPLHRRRYALGFGTVYTALYRPAAGRMRLAWPGLRPWDQGFGAFTEGGRRIAYPEGEAPRALSSRRAALHPDEVRPGPVH